MLPDVLNAPALIWLQCKFFYYALSRRLPALERSSVLHLLANCGPSTVGGCIITININSIKLKARRFLSNVGQKIVELTPAPAYRNSSRSIIFPSFVFWVCASLNHVRPRAVRLGRFVIQCVAMSSEKLLPNLFSKTSARFCLPISQQHIQNDNNVSAFAAAHTSRISAATFIGCWCRFGNYFKSSKLFSDKADFGRHNVSLVMLCLAMGDRRQPALIAKQRIKI